MTSLPELLQQGANNAWLFIPSAILLGALHGLEPGHSKTMMAAFIVAIRGTVSQAVLLGLAATVSHTAIVWLIALLGLHYGKEFYTEANEGYFQLVSAAIIIGVALWMLIRTYRDQKNAHDHHHDHAHDAVKRINTGHGIVQLEVFEDGVPPRFRLHFEERGRSVSPPMAESVSVATRRSDGTVQSFRLVSRGFYLESIDEIPEPHEFRLRLSISHDRHEHAFDVEFHEHHHPETTGLDVSSGEYQDAHERAHAEDIRKRFANQHVTTSQIVLFGLTGGLIPCPASITVLLLCLQLKQYTLGLTLVLCFSIGLALTMVTAGAAAALSVRAASRRFIGFNDLARKAPYISSILIIAVGTYTGYLGWLAIAGH